MKKVAIIYEANKMIAENLNDLFNFINIKSSIVFDYRGLKDEYLNQNIDIIIFNASISTFLEVLPEFFSNCSKKVYVIIIGEGKENFNFFDNKNIFYIIKPIEFAALYAKVSNLLESKDEEKITKKKNERFIQTEA